MTSTTDDFLRLTLASTAIVSLVIWGGCTFRYDFDECTSDQDCAPYEAPSDGRFLQCSADNRCVEIPNLDCRSDQHCSGQQTCSGGTCVGPTTDADGGGDADAGETGDGDASRSCQTNKDCIERFEEGWVCNADNQCMDATNDLCPNLFYPDDDRTDIVILGSIIPVSKPFAKVGNTLTNSVQLAVREYWENAPRTLPGGQKIAWLQCDATKTEDAPTRAAEHLVDVGAPAIIGPVRSQSYINVVNGVTADAGVLTITPSATSPAISNLSAAGTLSFRVIGNDRFQANAIVSRLKRLLSNKADNSVTVFYKDDQYGRDLQSELRSAVQSRSWIDKDDVRYLSTIAPASVDFDQGKIDDDFSTKVSDALSNQPDSEVVVFLGTGEMTDLAAKYITAAFQTNGPEPAKRRYLFSHGALTDLPSLPEKLQGDEKYVPLFEGTTPKIINRDRFAKFQTRYASFFNSDLSVTSAGVAYDAANMAILAMTGVPKEDRDTLEGREVAEVVASGRLQGEFGTEVSFGASDFQSTAKSALEGGNSVDVLGVSGNLDLNDDGDVRSDYLGIDAAVKIDLGGNRAYDVLSTRNWDLKDGKETGSWMSIPPAFVGGFRVSESPGTSITSGTVERTLSASNCQEVRVAQVSIDIDHPEPKDIEVALTSPNGSGPVTLRSSGLSQPPIKGKFPTTLLPDGKMATFLAKSGNGTWKLSVTDTDGTDSGAKLNSWGVSLYCE